MSKHQISKSRSEFYSKLREDAQWYWVQSPEIVRIDDPSPTTFLRNFVAKNRPVIITGLKDVQSWPAMKMWQNNQNMVSTQGEEEIRVNMTPNGFGDAVVNTTDHGELFIKPFETKMPLSEFFETINSSKDCVAYLSHQNDNLRQDFKNLISQVGDHLEISRNAFGNEAEALNLWIGDERSVSSMHKDFYENLYCVIKGEKVFHLLPPCVQPFLYEQEYQEAHYVYNKEGQTWDVELEDSHVSWTPIDPAVVLSNPDYYHDKYPLAKHIRDLTITANVKEGEVLYLPAMWYHRVTQSEFTIAVNYWHDMDFDLRWVYFNMLERMNDLFEKVSVENEADPGEESEHN